MERHGSNIVLTIGMVVSLVVHAAMAAAVVRHAHLAEQPGTRDQGDLARAIVMLEPEELEPPEDENPERLRLGLDSGDPEATAWLGFEDETEHHAREGIEDQSAMVLEESAATEGLAPQDLARADDAEMAPEEFSSEVAEEIPDQMNEQAEGLIQIEPASDFADMLSEAVSEDEGKQSDAVDHNAESGTGTSRFSDALSEAVLDVFRTLADALSEPPELSAEPSDQTEPSPADRLHDEGTGEVAVEPGAPPLPTLEPSPQSPSQSQADAARAGETGIISERESIATSIRHAPAVRMVDGRVRAAEGLEIQTRRPRWTFSTHVMRQPRNPTVEIHFGADGQVQNVRFARDGAAIYNTGYDDVDQPLLNAVYGWRARGKAIDDLPPDGNLRIFMTIILR